MNDGIQDCKDNSDEWNYNQHLKEIKPPYIYKSQLRVRELKPSTITNNHLDDDTIKVSKSVSNHKDHEFIAVFNGERFLNNESLAYTPSFIINITFTGTIYSFLSEFMYYLSFLLSN